MEIMLAALLMSVAIGSGAWYVLHAREVRSSLSGRVSSIPQDLKFPYTFQTSESQDFIPTGMTLEDSYLNKYTRQMYLAGYRHKKSLFYFQMINYLAIGLPALLIVLGALSGSFSKELLYRAFVAGFGLRFISRFLMKVRRTKIEKAVVRTLPQVLDLLIISLEAGLNFSSALPRVLEEMEPSNLLVKEFRLMHHEYLNGLSFAQACDRMSRRLDVMDLTIILTAITESEQMGSSLAHVLRVHANELRDKRRQRLREKAQKLPIRLLFPMLLIFVTIFVIALGPSAHQMSKQMKGLTQLKAEVPASHEDAGNSNPKK